MLKLGLTKDMGSLVFREWRRAPKNSEIRMESEIDEILLFIGNLNVAFGYSTLLNIE